MTSSSRRAMPFAPRRARKLVRMDSLREVLSHFELVLKRILAR